MQVVEIHGARAVADPTERRIAIEIQLRADERARIVHRIADTSPAERSRGSETVGQGLIDGGVIEPETLSASLFARGEVVGDPPRDRVRRADDVVGNAGRRVVEEAMRLPEVGDAARFPDDVATVRRDAERLRTGRSSNLRGSRASKAIAPPECTNAWRTPLTVHPANRRSGVADPVGPRRRSPRHVRQLASLPCHSRERRAP